MKRLILLALVLSGCGDGQYCRATISGPTTAFEVGVGQIQVERHGDVCHVEIRGDTVIMVRDVLVVYNERGVEINRDPRTK